MKKCCKKCRFLNYYDGYICGNELSKKDTIIENIDKEVCNQFNKRQGKFWLYKNSKF